MIKSLGLKFRGRNAWTQFRDHSPGLFPWYLSAADARFLTLALQQAVLVAQRFADDRDLLDQPAEGTYFVRVAERGAEGLAWHDAWLAPPAPAPPQATLPAPDIARAERLKGLRVSRAVWEAGAVPSPTPVQEERDQRPYYPILSLWVEHRSGRIIGMELSGPEQYSADFQSHFLTLIEQAGALPKEVRVGTPPPMQLLAPLAEVLGVRVTVAGELPMFNEAYGSMMAHFGGFEEDM